MKPLTTPKAIIISGIVIALSILMSSNKYSFAFKDNVLFAFDKKGKIYMFPFGSNKEWEKWQVKKKLP